MAVYHHRLNSISFSPQKALVGLTPGTPATFTATGAGSAVSIVSTNLQGDADSADDYVGWVVEAVGGTAANLGHMRKIVLYVDGTGTITTESFPAATASGDRFRLWVPPHGWWSVDSAKTAGASPIVHDAARTESAGFFVGAAEIGGPYLHAVNASALPSASLQLITAQSNGFVKTATWGAAVSVGDLVEAVYFPEVMNDALLTLDEAVVERQGPVGSYGRPASARGLRSVSGSVEMAMRGPGATRVGLHAESHLFLRCVCDHVDPVDATVDTGSSGTNVVISSGTPVAGRMYAVETGDVVMCTAFSAPNATVSPAPRTDPEGTQTLHGITTYTPSTGANSGLTCIQYRGNGIKEEMYGLLPAMSFSGARGEWLKVMANLTGVTGYRAWKDHAGTAFARPYRPKLPTVAPVRLTDCRAVLGSTELDIVSFSIDLGQQIAPKGGLKNENQQGGLELVDDNATGSIVAIVDSNMLTELDSFTAGEAQTLLIQAGAAIGFPGLFGFWAYAARYTGGTLDQADGQVQVTLPFQVTLSNTETTLPRWAVGIA